jgi:Cu(I)/Ag(I) efflux system membrane fusion protein
VALAGLQTWEVGYQPLARAIRTVGFVEFDERRLARITARVTGKSRIDKLHVNVTGQTVRKGEPLAQLYNPDLVVTVQNLLDARQRGNPGLERMARDRLRLWGIDDEQTDAILRTGKAVTDVTIRAPMSGHVIKKYQVEGEYVEEGARLYDVADLSTVWIEAQVYEDELAFLRVGLPVTAATRAFPNRLFRGTVAFVHPHLDAATRTLRVRFDMDNPHHDLRPGMYATVSLEVPASRLEAFSAALDEDWRNETVIDGLHHAVLGSAGLAADCRLEPLLKAAVRRALWHRDLVLTVPESAVIDTGRRKIVYREVRPGVYDSLEVQLGPRRDGLYAVVRGLEDGDRVVTAGSFLVDAETRLTAGAGSTYFGASGGPATDRSAGAAEARPSMTEDMDTRAKAELAKLSRVDRRLAEAQGYCPILQENPLGKMGPPLKLLLKGRPVFLCCEGCEAEARAHADQTLATVARLSARTNSGVPAETAASAGPATAEAREAARVQANLAKLSPEDRRLAEAQKYCAVQHGNLLGSMGVPPKILINGRPVFLCCRGCEDEAHAHPDHTLAAVERLKARR